MRRPSIFLVIIFLFFVSPTLHSLKPKSKAFASPEDADCYLTMRYNLGCKYYNLGAWRTAASNFEKVILFFPCSEAAAEASYYLAVCYFEMNEYDFANAEFSNYLKATSHPAYFEDAVYYKFCIAEHFKSGKRRRILKMRYFPKWGSAQDLALIIYDEVVAALPNHELTVRALYSKAELLQNLREYRESVETYQSIIRRFPKHEIVPACYLAITNVYLQQSRYEFQNPDILALVELNVRKFGEEYPRDERVEIAKNKVSAIKEMYAKGLCNLGLFYERMCQIPAAVIYYQSAIEEFPDTRVARFCRLRLNSLGYEEEQEEETSSSQEGTQRDITQNQSESCFVKEEPHGANEDEANEEGYLQEQQEASRSTDEQVESSSDYTQEAPSPDSALEASSYNHEQEAPHSDYEHVESSSEIALIAPIPDSRQEASSSDSAQEAFDYNHEQEASHSDDEQVESSSEIALAAPSSESGQEVSSSDSAQETFGYNHEQEASHSDDEQVESSSDDVQETPSLDSAEENSSYEHEDQEEASHSDDEQVESSSDDVQETPSPDNAEETSSYDHEDQEEALPSDDEQVESSSDGVQETPSPDSAEETSSYDHEDQEEALPSDDEQVESSSDSVQEDAYSDDEQVESSSDGIQEDAYSDYAQETPCFDCPEEIPCTYYPFYYEQEVPLLEAEAAIAEGAPFIVEEEPPKEEPATYIHYSLLKKRDRKYVPPRK